MSGVTLNRHGAAGRVIKAIGAARKNTNDGLKSIATGKNQGVGPAEKSIANKLSISKARLEVASAGAARGAALVGVAKAGIEKLIGLNARMGEIATAMNQGDIDAVSGALGQSDFAAMQAQHVAVVAQTRFNGVALIGAAAAATTFQTGDAITDIVTFTPTNLTNPGAIAALDVSTLAGAAAAITALDVSLGLLNTDYATASATYNQLVESSDFADTLADAAGTAISVYEDAGVEKMINSVTLNQVRAQAGTAMAVLANQDIRGLMSAING